MVRELFRLRYSHWTAVLRARKTPRQQRSRETVAVILEAAAQVFQRQGYLATTTNKIAERAGVSIGSVYQYFPDKDALLVALAEQELAASTELVDRLLRQLGAEDAPLDRLLRELLHAVAAAHTSRPELHRLLFDEAPRLPALVARFRAAERRLAVALAEQLRRLGSTAPDVELTALLAVQGITAQLHGAVLDPPAGVSPQQCVDRIVQQWGRALAPDLKPTHRPDRHPCSDIGRSADAVRRPGLSYP
jgi:AcrR family transcriptional regulator